MKYLKILSLAAVAAMAMMAFASSASATTIIGGSPEKTLGSGDTIDFSIPSGKSAVLVDTEGGELDTCSGSTVNGKLSSAATGSIESLTWTGCTFPTSTVTKGKLEVVSTGGTNGEVKADAEIGVTINTIFFGSCVYGVTSGTKVGTVAGNPAVFTANAVAKKLSGSNIACPETSKWTGTYNATTANLHVEP